MPDIRVLWLRSMCLPALGDSVNKECAAHLATAIHRLKHAHTFGADLCDICSDRNLMQTKSSSKLLPCSLRSPFPLATSAPDCKVTPSLTKFLGVSVLVHFPLSTAVTIGTRDEKFV